MIFFNILRFFEICQSIISGKSCPGAQGPWLKGQIACSGLGKCDPTTGTCICNEGNQGLDCSGNIYNMNVMVAGQFMPSVVTPGLSSSNSLQFQAYLSLFLDNKN